MRLISRLFIITSLAIISFYSQSMATSLSLGADYLLRGVSAESYDKTFKSQSYYDQQISAYLITDLSKDVEATIRIQSITPWGQENSTTSLTTAYPDANGDLFIQNAFVRLPNIWRNRIVITAGRQPIEWGEGDILSDNDIGFNAIHAQVRSPYRWLPVDLDGFTAKINETLTTKKDTDLHGATLGFDRKSVRWEIMGLWEKDRNGGQYEYIGVSGLQKSTVTINATRIDRKIYGVRARSNLKDAFLQGAYYIQDGEVEQGANSPKISLGGQAYMIGLGGKQDTEKIGRFGAILEFLQASGDSTSTSGKDEAFRPTFARRWNGLERSGRGKYFASTFSDAYSAGAPFAPVDSVNDGLPEGASGIQTIHLGVELTPWAQWTFTVDYYQYKATNKGPIAKAKDLGTEFDYGFIFQYTGLVVIKGNFSTFNPKEAFDEDTRQKATYSTIEAGITF